MLTSNKQQNNTESTKYKGKCQPLNFYDSGAEIVVKVKSYNDIGHYNNKLVISGFLTFIKLAGISEFSFIRDDRIYIRLEYCM